MNRLRIHVFLALSGHWLSRSSLPTTLRSRVRRRTRNNVDPGASSSGNVELDGSSNVIDPDNSTGGPVGTGTVTGPAAGQKCRQGSSVASEGECARPGLRAGFVAKGRRVDRHVHLGAELHRRRRRTSRTRPGRQRRLLPHHPVPSGSSPTTTDLEAEGLAVPPCPTPRSPPRARFEVTGPPPRVLQRQAGQPRERLHPRRMTATRSGTGWRDSWNVRLPSSFQEINDRMIQACSGGGDNANWGATMDGRPGAKRVKPANCI